MKKIIRWLGWTVLGLGIVAVALIIGGYALLKQTVAPFKGEANLAGLSENVSVVRDEHGIVHIEGKSRLDAIRALGWIHASERIWQMEVLRMAGQGRLSEMFGSQTISSDRFLKTLNISQSAQNSMSVLRDDTVALMRAYVDGVNAWIDRDTSPFEPALPIEFIILGHSPEKWEPWHSISVLKVMALTLDANMDEEIGRLALAGKGFNPRQIDEVYPAGPRDNPPLLPDLRVLYGFGTKGKLAARNATSEKSANQVTAQTVSLATAPWQLQLPASNNWAISGKRTESGKPLLANDPHLGLTAPSVFYLAHLNWEDGGKQHHLIGGSLPGTPHILSGRNDRLAWGLTTTYLDSQDLFLEQLNPENPNEYRTPSGFEPFETQEVTIKVKGGDDVVFTRSITRHGPVLPDGYKKLKERLPDNHVAALSWTALTDDDTTMNAIFDMATSENVNQFIDKTRALVSPMQSVVVADVEGNIGLVAPGRVPVRSKQNLVHGRAPVPGWEAVYDWNGYLSPEDVPTIVNPVFGAVATANANWLPPDYDKHITYDWAEHFRQDRVEELYVRSNTVQSMKTMIAGQRDMVSRALIQFRDDALRQIPQGVLVNEEILEALRAWDGKMDRDKPEPLILTAWHKNLQEIMLKDDLGEDYELVEKGNLTRILSMLRSTGARNWCNVAGTPKGETCGDILFQSIEASLAELSEKYGSNWKNWRWAEAHKTLHEHRPFTQVGALSRYFTIRQEMSGGTYTLLRNSNNFSKKEPYAGMHGSALRTVYDFADLEKSLFIISTGQSGNVMSPHYDDLAKIWGELDYIPMVTKPENYRRKPVGEFILKKPES